MIRPSLMSCGLQHGLSSRWSEQMKIHLLHETSVRIEYQKSAIALTMVELLVVVTIVVVLLSLLAPAMDKAIYQAELAVCGSRLKSLSTAARTYTAGNKRAYPYRNVIKKNSGQPSRLVSAWPAGFFDDRAM